MLHVALLLALDTVTKECVYCDTYHLEVGLILLPKSLNSLDIVIVIVITICLHIA